MKQDETTTMAGISFKCKQCGCCCFNRGDIMVTPMDLVRYCKFFKLTPKEFLMRYTWKKPEYNKLPKISLISKNDIFKSCIFFEADSGCVINAIKPPVCYYYPLVEDLIFGSGEIIVHDKSCDNAKNLQCLSQEEMDEYINLSSNGRYHTEKPLIKKFILLSAELEFALMKRPGKNERHIRKFFEDFYLNLDINDEKYLEKKFKEWEDIICFI